MTTKLCLYQIKYLFVYNVFHVIQCFLPLNYNQKEVYFRVSDVKFLKSGCPVNIHQLDLLVHQLPRAHLTGRGKYLIPSVLYIPRPPHHSINDTSLLAFITRVFVTAAVRIKAVFSKESLQGCDRRMYLIFPPRESCAIYISVQNHAKSVLHLCQKSYQ